MDDDFSFEGFTTARLVIRRFAVADAEDLASYRSDLEVARYQDWVCGAWFQFAVSLTPSGLLKARGMRRRRFGR